jgi:hypothetical protein
MHWSVPSDQWSTIRPIWRTCDCGVFMQTWFGPGVRSIVEGETRFSKIGNYKEASPEEPIDLKALDLQQLFLAMTEEVHSGSP